MSLPTTSTNKKEKDKVDVSVRGITVTDSPHAKRLRSQSVGSVLGQQRGNDSKSTANPSKRTQLSKCPCLSSNEKSWKIKCSQCKQVWHTVCCNLSAKSINEKIILELEKDWSCPWCFVAPFLRPPNHPSIQNESKLFGTVVAGVIGDSIAEAVDECLTAKTTELKLSIDKCIAEAVDSQMKKLEDLKVAKEESPIASTATPPTEKLAETNPTSHIEDYNENFLSNEEALETKEVLSKMKFTRVKGREVASFGEKYSYTGAPSNNIKDIPDHLCKLIEKVKQIDNYRDMAINQVVVNKYIGNNSFLPEHSDNEPSLKPHSKIFTVSVGTDRNVQFRDKCTSREHDLMVTSGSLYVMTQESQHYWTHRIEKEETNEDARYSITFRSVGSNFRNATVILGDSNTKHLKFGSGQQGEKGTFGYHLPGKRVENFHIRNINAEDCIGYQNVLIHCGINDLRDKSPGRQPDDPEPTDIEAHFSLLVQKIKEIKSLCPYTSISVSPLLPTKNFKLNKRVIQFNTLLFDFISTKKDSEGVQCLDFSEFVDADHGILREDLGTWDSQNNCYNKKDILHLGKIGIRLLAKVVKQSLLHKYITMRSYRDSLSLNLGVS